MTRLLPPTLIAAALCATVLAQAAAAEAPDSFRLQTAINQAQSDANSVQDALDGGTWSDISSALFDLQNRKLEIDRAISDYQSLESQVRSYQSRVQRLRIEWETAQNQYNSQQRKNEDDKRRIDAEVKAHNAKVAAVEAEWDLYNADVAEYDRDGVSYRRDLAAYEAAGSMNDAEYRRLLRWYNEREAWRGRINRRNDDLGGRANENNSRKAILDRRLDQIYNDARLLELRIAASEKERDYRLADSERARMQEQLDSMAADINGRIDSGIAAAGSLSASLAGARRAASSASSGERTFSYYAPGQVTDGPAGDGQASYGKIPDNVRAVPLAPGRALSETGPSFQGRAYVIPSRTGDYGADALADKVRSGVLAKTLEQYESRRVTGVDTPAAFRSFDSTHLAWSRLPDVDVTAGEGEQPADDALVLGDVVDPDLYFSESDRRLARKEKQRLEGLIEKLEDKLAEVRGWQGDLLRYQDEMLALRRELAQNDLANALSMAQIGNVAERLSKMPRYEKAFDKKTVEAIRQVEAELVRATKDAESLISAYDSESQALQAKQDSERVGKSLDSVCELLKVGVNQLPLDDPARPWMEHTLKVYNAAFKLMTQQMREGESQRPDDQVRAERVVTAVEIMAIFYPPAAVGMGLGNEINDWRMNKYYIQPAVEDLSAALAGNYEAQRHLQRKVERSRQFLQEHERVLQSDPHRPGKVNSLRD